MSAHTVGLLPKTLKALRVVVGVVPGVVGLTTGLGVPPGARAIFSVALEVVGVGMVAKVVLKPSTTPVRIGRSVFVGLVLVAVYWIAFDTAVVTHDFGPEEAQVVVPYFTPSWAPPTLDTLVYCAQNRESCPGAFEDYSAEDVGYAAGVYGPDEIAPLIPPWPYRGTVLVVFLAYASCVAYLVHLFSTLAWQVGKEPSKPDK